MASLEDQQALLLYRVGPVLCCAPSLSVLSIIQPLPLTHPPGADPARPGIFRHSGRVVKTEELRVRFGVDESDRRPGRMIIVEVDSGPTAFWVDDIIDVISMPTTGWGQLPPHLPRGIFSRTLLRGEQIFLYAEFDALQKLQGHGLLKTYIEKLLAASPPQRADKAPATEVVTETVRHPPVVPTTPVDRPVTVAIKTELPRIEQSIKKTEPTRAAAKKSTPTSSAVAVKYRPPPGRLDTAVKKTLPPVSKPLSGGGAKTSLTPAGRKAVATGTRPSPLPVTQRPPTDTTSMTTKRSAAIEKHTSSPGASFPWRGLLILMLLLAGSGTGLYYYLQTPVKTSAVTPATTAEPVVYESPPPPAALPPTVSVPAVEMAPAAVPAREPETTTVSSTASPVIPADTAYQAKIEQDDQGITIVIKAPKEEAVFIGKPLEDTSAANTALPAAETTPVAPTATTEKTPPPSAPRREEILHIVVKGDTLWHIAKRYVHNPFRYPELARLSNIKNPDRIYPGNRVRIIREFN